MTNEKPRFWRRRWVMVSVGVLVLFCGLPFAAIAGWLYVIAPEQLEPIWMYEDTNVFESFAVDGDTLYTAQNGTGILVWDISNPALPQLVSTIPYPDKNPDSWRERLLFHKGYLYVDQTDNVFYVFDLTDPTQPRLMDVPLYETLPPVGDMLIVNEHLVLDVMDPELDFILVDITDPNQPAIVLEYNSGGTLIDLTASDELIIFYYFDHPDHFASSNSNVIVVDENMINDRISNWQMVDLSIPSEPKPVSVVPIDHGAVVHVYGDHAYVGSLEGFKVYDVTDFDKVQLVGEIRNLPGAALFSHVIVDGQAAYVLGIHSLSVVNVSDPRHPVPDKHFDTIYPDDLFVRGPYIYLLSNNRFYIFEDTPTPLWRTWLRRLFY